jgi:hypothetical protein
MAKKTMGPYFLKDIEPFLGVKSNKRKMAFVNFAG